MSRLHQSTGVACAICLVIVGCWSAGEARPLEKRATPTVSATDSEQSIHRALTESVPAKTLLLLDRGANIEARNARGATPLITAAARGNLALVALLLKQGAQVDARDREGNTALHEASFQSHPPCVEALLAAGAQTTTRNQLGFTPLHQAVRRFWETAGESRADRLTRQMKVISGLLHAGANPGTPDQGGRIPAVLALESDNAALQQAFNAPPPHPALAADSPRAPAADETSTRDSGHPGATAPGEARSNADGRSTDAADPASPIEAPGEAPANPLSSGESGQATAPPAGNPSVSLPEPSTAASLDPPAAVTPKTDISPMPTPESTATAPAAAPLPIPTLPSPHSIPTPDLAAALSPADHSLGSKASGLIAPSSAPQASGRIPPTEPVPAPEAASSSQEHPPNAPQRPHSEWAFASSGLAKTSSAVETSPADSARQPATPPPPPGESDISVVRTPSPRPGVPVSGLAGENAVEDHSGPWFIQNLGFGLGLGWTHNLGPRRVESVSVTNRIVRIDDERNDLVRVMPEVHLWIDRWDEQRWSWGPFLALAPGSRIIDAVGGGLMVGYRPHHTNQYSFNFAIGGTLDLDTRVLGDGIVANQPLPPRETSARTKQTSAAGLLLLFSVGWDLSTPRPAQQVDRK